MKTINVKSLLTSYLKNNKALLNKYVDAGIVSAHAITYVLDKLMRHLLGTQGIDPNTSRVSKLRELYSRAIEEPETANYSNSDKSIEDVEYEAREYYDNAVVNFVLEANKGNIIDPVVLDNHLSEIVSTFSDKTSPLIKSRKPQTEREANECEQKHSRGGNDFMTPCTNDDQIKPDPIIIINDEPFAKVNDDAMEDFNSYNAADGRLKKDINDPKVRTILDKLAKDIKNNKPLVLDTPSFANKLDSTGFACSGSLNEDGLNSAISCLNELIKDEQEELSKLISNVSSNDEASIKALKDYLEGK
jgi:hypothetical protein